MALNAKKAAWKHAEELVNPIIEKHGLAPVDSPSSIVVKGTTINTPVNQHIEHLIGVAEWLMEEG